jgi:hypothetical protein
MDSKAHILVGHFAHAGLALTVSSTPLRNAGNAGIVQLDIGRGKTKRDEHFRLFHGARDNRVEVLGTDKALEQLVLLVHEPARRFELEVNAQWAERNNERIVRVSKNGRQARIERVTDARKRHFLCGMDEQHCFIAQLPQPVSSVALAHQVLKPRHFDTLSRHAQRHAVRQGEFFFAPVTTDELKRFGQLGRGARVFHSRGIAFAAGWKRAGREHIASEVWPVSEAEAIVLVRGHVWHPDHKTLHFPEWVRVLQNTEAVEVQPPGVFWVD